MQKKFENYGSEKDCINGIMSEILTNNFYQNRIKSRMIFILGIILIFIGILLYIKIISEIPKSTDDFMRDYFAARHYLVGESIYLDTIHPNYHPPFVALFILPLAILPYNFSITIWSLTTFCLYLFSIFLVLNELIIKLPLEWFLLLTGFLLSWYPFLENLILGQFSIIISFCVIAGWVLLRRGKEKPAGFLLGLACLFKLFPLIFLIYLFFRKRWWSLVIMMVTVITGLFITAIIIGPQSLVQYMVVIAPRDVADFSHYPINISFSGIFRRLFTDNDLFVPVFNSPLLSTIAISFCSILLVSILIWQIFRVKTQFDDDISYALFITAMLLISPITWEHILPILVLPFGLLLFYLVKKPDPFIRYSGLITLIFVSLPNYYIARYIYNTYLPGKIPWPAGLLVVLPTIGLLITFYGLILVT